METELGTMTPSETEFLSEKETVSIVPNFTLGKLYLISGDVGPFTPSIPVTVPLWLAISLKQWHKCRIVPPPWFDVETCENIKQEELGSEFFTAMPSGHYMEVAQLLYTHALSDIPHADEIRTLIKDIWDIRAAKLRNSIDMFMRSDETYARLNHLTVMEINTVRGILTKSLDRLHQLQKS